MPRLEIADRIAEALAARRGVVALETTVVTHGFPRPDGVRIARDMEDVITRGGAMPATIGVEDGVIRVGLTEGQLSRLASTPDVSKVNPGNLAAVLARGGAGATTVAATMLIAARVGIHVFATGGIGGVHRDAVDTDDVSADLVAFARWPVAVVAAGAKAVLDVPRTAERLESLGVPVLGFRTDRFPAFYRRDGGAGVDARLDSIPALAAAVRAHFALEIGGVLVANPVPESDEMPRELHDSALAGALADARSRGVRGRAVTPYLLERMRERTGDRSLAVNRALLLHNAAVAAELAVALAAVDHHA
jgi:pseudouridine-5'-phosphate glycosidase